MEVIKNINNIEILTPNGFESFYGVRKLTKPNSVKLRFKNGTFIECSLNHRFMLHDGSFIEASYLKRSHKIITQYGKLTFVIKKVFSKHNIELFDIIDSGKDKIYYSDGIVSHNCEFLGSTNSLINGFTLNRLDSGIKAPLETTNEGFFVYENPIPGHTYIITIDTSHGVGADYSAFNIIDVSSKPFRQVAKFYNNKIDPTYYASVVFFYAQNYNNAWTLTETNDIGIEVANSLFANLEYQNVITTNHTDKVGIRMSVATKNLGCVALKSLVESSELEIVDADTVFELSTFEKQNKSFSAAEGKHDDLCMSLVMFGWLTRQNIFDEIINASFRFNLSEAYSDKIAENLAPIGFLNGSQYEKEEYFIEGGDVWLKDPLF